MTTETNDAGPQQVGVIDAAAIAAEAAKAGISMPPKSGEVDPNAKVAGEASLPSDETNVEDEGAADRPGWLPEKFKTVEEMAAAYAELEKKQGTKPEDGAEAPAKTDGSEPPKTEEGQKVADIVTKAGLDWAKLNDEWKAGGKLSDASYEAFSKQGISQELVDGYINGQNAIGAAAVNVVRNAAFETAGGEAKYMEAIEWAATGWSPAEIKAFDKAVSGTDPAAVKLAVSGLMAAHSKSGGNEPSNVARTSRAGQGVYQNMEQVIADMQNPKYDEDPAFRQRVSDKVARSSL